MTKGWVCRLQLLLVLASRVIIVSASRGTHEHILLSQIRDSPNLEGQVYIFISPRNRVAQRYPQALGSLSIASYDSQGHGGVRNRLHTVHSRLHGNVFASLSKGLFTKKSVSVGMCLPSLCLAMGVYSDFTIPAFGRHVTI
jgi:hypothetical protein